MLATKTSSMLVQLAVGGILALLVAIYKPEIVILLILGMTSTIIDHDTLPRWQRFRAPEVLLMLLLGLVLVKILSGRREDRFVSTPLDWPIFLFFVVSTISVLNGLYNLETVDQLINTVWRALWSYLLFFAVTNLVRTRQQLMTLLGGMLVMATMVAALMIAQQVVGTSVNILPNKSVATNATVLGQQIVGATRVEFPGAALVYIMLLPAFILHTTPGYLNTHKWISFIPVVLLPMATLFTFTRSLWIGAVVSSVVYILAARFESLNFIWLGLVLVVAAALLIPILNEYFPRVDTVVEALHLRAGSLFSGDELVYDDSTQWRLKENELALAKFREHPILGIGPHGIYRAPWSERDTRSNYHLCRYVHNDYLLLLLDTGLAGFLPFLWFSIAHLLRGLALWRTIKDPILKSLVIGFTASFIGVLVTSMAMPRLTGSYYTPLIAVMLGVNAVAIKLAQQSYRSGANGE